MTVYGSDKRLRVMLEGRGQPHVLAVRTNENIVTRLFVMQTAAEIIEAMAPEVWERLAAGEGAKGLRLYHWARVRIERLQDPDAPFEHWLLVRRSLKDPEQHAYYVVFAPARTTLAELAAALRRAAWSKPPGSKPNETSPTAPIAAWP